MSGMEYVYCKRTVFDLKNPKVIKWRKNKRYVSFKMVNYGFDKDDLWYYSYCIKNDNDFYETIARTYFEKYFMTAYEYRKYRINLILKK